MMGASRIDALGRCVIIMIHDIIYYIIYDIIYDYCMISCVISCMISYMYDITCYIIYDVIYDIIYDIIYDYCMISFMISHLISYMTLQVEDAEKALKMKIRPRNAFLSCYKLNFLAAMPREELHQFLIGLYCEYIVP